MNKHILLRYSAIFILIFAVVFPAVAGTEWTSNVEVLPNDKITIGDGMDITWSWKKNADNIKYYIYNVNNSGWVQVENSIRKITTFGMNPDVDNTIYICASDNGSNWSLITKQTLHKKGTFEYADWLLSTWYGDELVQYISNDGESWENLEDFLYRKAEAERLAREEAERLRLLALEEAERQRLEAERIAREEAEARRIEALHNAQLEKERLYQEWLKKEIIKPYEISATFSIYPMNSTDGEITGETNVGAGLGFQVNYNNILATVFDASAAWDIKSNATGDKDYRVSAGIRVRLLKSNILNMFAQVKGGVNFYEQDKNNKKTFKIYPMVKPGLVFRFDPKTNAMLDLGFDGAVTWIGGTSEFRFIPYFSTTLAFGQGHRY